MTELEARQLKQCPACGRDKSQDGGGLIVCWECFKRTPDPITPFKHWNGTLDAWLAHYRSHRPGTVRASGFN
jgi:hypothetical protein